MTPAGYLAVTSKVMKRHADAGNVDAFQAYVRSDEFAKAMVSISPEQRQSLLRYYAKYSAECEANTRYRKVEPKRRRKSRWQADAARDRLAKAYAIAGEDHEKAGRLLGCTAGAARLARRKYLLNAAQPQSEAA